jgi:hypothetical protein
MPEFFRLNPKNPLLVFLFFSAVFLRFFCSVYLFLFKGAEKKQKKSRKKAEKLPENLGGMADRIGFRLGGAWRRG